MIKPLFQHVKHVNASLNLALENCGATLSSLLGVASHVNISPREKDEHSTNDAARPNNFLLVGGLIFCEKCPKCVYKKLLQTRNIC